MASGSSKYSQSSAQLPQLPDGAIAPFSWKTLPAIIDALDANKSVVLPTETVYGLCARADRPEAMDGLFTLKAREPNKPVAICVSDLSGAEAVAELSPLARTLIEAFWPGPLTLVVPAKPGALDARALGPDGYIGLRCADAEWQSAFVIAGYTAPLALTSANISGLPPARTARQAADAFGAGVALIIDGGAVYAGQPSTVLRLTGSQGEILREGQIKAQDLAKYDMDWV